MKNEAAPSYFNGGTKQQNQDYRYKLKISINTEPSLDFSVNVHNLQYKANESDKATNL